MVGDMKVGLRVVVVPFVLGVLALVSVAGCAAEVISVPSPPTKARYQISFPSTRVAVAAESLQVSVFDATNGAQAGTDCLSLVTKQKSKADLPKALAQTAVVPICD